MVDLILQGTSTPLSTLGSAAGVDTLLGVKQALVHWHFPMANGRRTDGTLKYIGFQTLADSLWRQGQLLVYTWGSWDLAGKTVFPFTEVAAGQHDAYLHSFAQQAATWGHPFFVRLDHEMNGTWAPWFAGNDPAGFVAMWRHIVDLFRADGATNVTWVWCPNSLSTSTSSSTHPSKLPALYPGDDYVDWTGFDGYNWATVRNASWLTFQQVVSGGVAGLADTYGTIAQLAPSKPMMLAEWGSSAQGGNKAAWLQDALAIMPQRYPLIRAQTYFQKQDGTADWPLLATDGTAAAYGTAIKTGPYVRGGEFEMPPDLQPIRPFTATVRAMPLHADVPYEIDQITQEALEDALTQRDALQEKIVAIESERDQAQQETSQVRAAVRLWADATNALVQLAQP